MPDDPLSLFPGESPPPGESGAARGSASAAGQEAPLAERMRPRGIDEIVGQQALVGPEGLVRRLQETGRIPSLILHGPPGSGKTTLGRLLAGAVGAAFVPFSAVSEGVPRLREIVKAAEERRRAGKRTLVFVDEIHRLNKGQQDFLLPYVESGLITLVGATTEHPAFEVNAALLSRTRVLLLEPLAPDQLKVLLQRALDDRERGLGELEVSLTVEAEEEIVERSAGDARQALTVLDLAAELAGSGGTIDIEIARAALQQRTSGYDTTTAFQMLSAFHKSLRASRGDAALYWAMRMVRNGEDPLILFRRLIAAAYEDVGLSDPQAGVVATQAMQAFERLGVPEGLLPLSNAVLYVANATKSNRAYLALKAAQEAAERFPDSPVPLQLRNASTSLMREWGFGEGYRYAHDFEDAYVDLECLPDDVAGTTLYEPSDRGYEADIRARMKGRGQL
ncbi:MAG: replication-associated recombination protein A [Gemmatimonadota bacterium]